MIRLSWKSLDETKKYVIEGLGYGANIPCSGEELSEIIDYLNDVYFEEGFIDLYGFTFEYSYKRDQSNKFNVTLNGIQQRSFTMNDVYADRNRNIIKPLPV